MIGMPTVPNLTLSDSQSYETSINSLRSNRNRNPFSVTPHPHCHLIPFCSRNWRWTDLLHRISQGITSSTLSIISMLWIPLCALNIYLWTSSTLQNLVSLGHTETNIASYPRVYRYSSRYNFCWSIPGYNSSIQHRSPNIKENYTNVDQDIRFTHKYRPRRYAQGSLKPRHNKSILKL